jgi:hypothetical protein
MWHRSLFTHVVFRVLIPMSSVEQMIAGESPRRAWLAYSVLPQMNKGACMNRIGVLALLLAATIFPLASNLVAEQPLSAKVPFAFSVANRNLPAGEYRIERHGVFLSIEDRDYHRMVTLIANPGERSEDGRSFLSFDEVNGVRFLRRVTTPSVSSSAELAAPRTNKLARAAEHHQRSMDEPQQ